MNTGTLLSRLLTLVAVLASFTPAVADHHGKLWNDYAGREGPGKGKKIVLVSGDEEYRSEEALSQLGKILAVHHGFDCRVVYAIDPETGIIDPNNRHNIPGLEALASADLMIIATRFRDLPDDQMAHIDAYLRRGGPVIGLRTATHAFNLPAKKKYGHYGNGYRGDKKEWQDGFGRLVLGEKWISHHGRHGGESTRGIIAPGKKDHPVNRGIEKNSIWGPSDVYGVRLPLPGDSETLVLGAVLKGMKPGDEPVEGKKNDPMMPLAWVKSYQVPGGKKGQSFTTTLGAASDLVAEGSRRMIVNAAYFLLGLEVPAGGTKVDTVGKFEASPFGFKKKTYFLEKGMRPSDFALKKD